MVNLDSRIAVVCGGTSTEREVSLRSGRAVYNALLDEGYSNSVLFDLNGNIHELININPDVVYLALHGVGGEDGSVQGFLELANIPYTGPGIASSAICMNKILTKQILHASDIPTAKYCTASRHEPTSEIKNRIVNKIGIPAVLKSPCQGSSIGVVIIKKEEDLEYGIEEVFKYGDNLLAEKFLNGIELTLPIIGSEEIEILPEIEITSEREFYDYTAKYTEGLFHHIIPSRITEEVRERVREIGERTYRALCCKGISRIDFIVDAIDGPMVVEVNTSPGMTETSLVPDSAKAANISFGSLVLKILDYALM